MLEKYAPNLYNNLNHIVINIPTNNALIPGPILIFKANTFLRAVAK